MIGPYKPDLNLDQRFKGRPAELNISQNEAIFLAKFKDRASIHILFLTYV